MGPAQPGFRPAPQLAGGRPMPNGPQGPRPMGPMGPQRPMPPRPGTR